MNHVPIPDEQFNKVARTSDLETPVDRFYDLIMAVFHSSIQEALNPHSRHPDREPNAGLVRNAAAWLQETMMPDVSQQDIAQKISDWIISRCDRHECVEVDEAISEWTQDRSLAPFM